MFSINFTDILRGKIHTDYTHVLPPMFVYALAHKEQTLQDFSNLQIGNNKNKTNKQETAYEVEKEGFLFIACP